MPETIQSMLHPAGVQADRIAWLWWLMFGVCTTVYVLVLAGLAMAVRRSRSSLETRPSRRSLTTGVAAAVGVTVVTLFVLLTASSVIGRQIAGIEYEKPLEIEVTGHQWWWDVVYPNEQPHLTATTANEIHLPVGRHVRIKLRSSDVIHSLWIPNLHGKMDLIPGRANEMWLIADKPGVYRGQCAEFCGLQHAHMALTVVVEAPETFEGWLAAQRLPAVEPVEANARRGREIVEQGPCAMCHTIRGTLAGGRTAPDLTHLASRSTLAAGTVPNTPGYLGGWILDPQHLKPGAKMPPIGLDGDDLQALLAYLGTLK